MAGVKIDKIIIEMKSERVIRSMPNLATHVGKSMTGWFATKGINENDKENIKQILELIGHEVEVQEEKMLDDITAISGSGPAYFFYLCELLQEKAQEFGFSKEQAKILAEETFIGSALVLNMREKEVKEWREAVSSKKGATEVAIKYLEDKQFGEIFKGAIDKAKKRFEEV